MKNSQEGFAALLLIIMLSASIMVTMLAVSDSTWLLRSNVQSLGDRTQSQLAALSCKQLAMLHIAENPDYQSLEHIDFGKGVSCEIVSVADVVGGVGVLEKKIVTRGLYRELPSVMEILVHATNTGLIEKYAYYR